MASNELWLHSVDDFFFCRPFCCSTLGSPSRLFYATPTHAMEHGTRARASMRAQAHIHMLEDCQLMSVGEKQIDKYLQYLPVEVVPLNWAERRQMRHSKLNK